MWLHTGSVLLLILCTTFLASTRLSAQAHLPEPDLRIPDAPGRASRVRDSIARLPQETRANYVHIDTTRGGVTWIQFDRVTRPQATPEAAAAQFLAVYGTPVLGIDATHGRLELLRELADGNAQHFRYVQRHAGYRVLHGQWLVHVRRGSRGYAVEGANGWVFPDIGAPVVPNVGRTAAENAAVGELPRASVSASADTAPVVLAHGGAYRVAYLVSVFDADREMVLTRYVDAVNGAVFAESPSGNDDAPKRSPSASPPARATPARLQSPLAPNSVVLGSFVSTTGTDWDSNSRQFNVWQESTNDFRLRDNQHAPAASEIQVRNLAGQDIHTVCDNADSIVQRATINPWPSDTAGREEVSAVHNLGEVVSYFYTKAGMLGMRDNGAILTGCVHGTDSDFNASYSLSNHALKFRQATGNDAPSVAAIDGVGHEFAHGVYHYWVGETSGTGPDAVNAGLADFFGARIRNNMRCARDGYINPTEGCLRYLDVDSMLTVGYCASESTPTGHCLGIRLSSALLDATEASSGSFAGKVDSVVYSALQAYMTPSMDLYDAAYSIMYFARQVGHQGTYPPYTSMYNASPTLELALLSNLLHGHPPVTVQMAPSYDFTLTISPTFYVYDITFEIGTLGQGFNYDGSIQWPDSEIPLGENYYYEGPIDYGQDDLDWHSCSDGHAHGFRVTVNSEYGPLTYYTAMSGCGGSLIGGPAPTDALPRKFAVRQAIQTSNGIVSASLVGSGGQQGSLGAQVRQYGLTALEIDIPINTVPAPIEMTVYNPQGRVIRRLVTTPMGPGTERIPWDRKNDRGEQAPPGVYVVLVSHGSNRHRTHFIIPAER